MWGSRRELAQMMEFIREKRILLVVSRVLRGIANLDRKSVV